MPRNDRRDEREGSVGKLEMFERIWRNLGYPGRPTPHPIPDESVMSRTQIKPTTPEKGPLKTKDLWQQAVTLSIPFRVTGYPYTSSRETTRVTPCAACGRAFQPSRKGQKFCSHACRQRAYRIEAA